MTAQKKQKGLAVIGCTGSVGSSVMDVCRCYPGEFSVKALAAGSGRDSISALCREFSRNAWRLRAGGTISRRGWRSNTAKRPCWT